MKSHSGNASTEAVRMMVLKLSTVEHSTCIRAASIGARPDHRRVGGDVAGLDAAGNQGAVSGAAQIGFGDAADAGDCDCRGGSHEQLTPVQNLPGAWRRWASNLPSSNHEKGVPAEFDLAAEGFTTGG